MTPLGHQVLTRYRQMEADAGKAIAAGIADLRRHLKPDGAAAPTRQSAAAGRAAAAPTIDSVAVPW